MIRSVRTRIIAICLLGWLSMSVAASSSFPPVLDLSELDGSNGFSITGETEWGEFGYAVSGAGDINADGYSDVVIGAWRAPDSKEQPGRAYAIYGGNHPRPANLDVSELSAAQGMIIETDEVNAILGTSVTGDIDLNGDGIGDFVVSAPGSDADNGTGPAGGRVYVIFGSDQPFPLELNVSNLDGNNGFVVESANIDEQIGFSLASAGDVNNDGFDDLIIGAPFSDISGESAGAAYVIFGRDGSFPKTLRLSQLDGDTGFVLTGESVNDTAGRSVTGLGDVNGDGIDDIALGANRASPGDLTLSGRSYVVFGTATPFPEVLSLESLDGSIGFKINGESEFTESGRAVSGAGDVNSDGLNDIVIGAYRANVHAGLTYVITGSASGYPAEVELAVVESMGGSRIEGESQSDQSGWFVAGIGDIDGDGSDDLLIGAPRADPYYTNAGRTYALFGSRSGLDSSIFLADLEGVQGFKIDGVNTGDFSGYTLGKAGDFNGDGLPDFLVGAYGYTSGFDNYTGRTYVIFGNDHVFADGFE